MEEQPAPAAPPAPMPTQSPSPKGGMLPQILWTASLQAEPHHR